MIENFALVNLYHPTGAKVSIPVCPDNPLSIDQAMNLVASVDALLHVGFTVNLPSLMDGEQFEQIGFAARREKVNDDNTATPVIDVYPVNGNFRVVGLYLNSPDDVKAFETASGLRLDAMPLYDGNPIERGKNPRMDRYVVPLKSPAKLVWKLNPKWEGDEDKRHAKRQFVRWDGLRPQASTSAPEVDPTLAAALKVLTPGGNEMQTLDVKQLRQLIDSTNQKVTDEMRQAAFTVLQSKGA